MQQESVDSKKSSARMLRSWSGSSLRTYSLACCTILTVLGLFLPFTMLLSILILPPLMVAFTDRKFHHRCECRKTAKCSTTP